MKIGFKLFLAGILVLVISGCASAAKTAAFAKEIEEGLLFSDPFYRSTDPSTPVEEQSAVVSLMESLDFIKKNTETSPGKTYYVSCTVTAIDGRETNMGPYSIVVLPPGKHTFTILFNNTTFPALESRVIEISADLKSGEIYKLTSSRGRSAWIEDYLSEYQIGGVIISGVSASCLTIKPDSPIVLTGKGITVKTITGESVIIGVNAAIARSK